MSYISIVKTAFIAFPLVAAIITVPFILVEYHKYGSVNKLRTLIVYSFILYMMTVYFLVILPLPDVEEVRKLTTPTTQLIPFKFIYDFISNTPLKLNDFSTYIPALKHSSFYTVFFNILMTVPFGMYLNYYYKCDLKKVIKYSFILSLFFELTQLTGLYFIYPRPYRLFDVDDLIMNTLGGVCGYFLMNKLNHLLPTRDEIDEKSFNDGLKISGLKRLVLFCLDGLICSVIITFIMLFLNFSFVKYIIIFIYYVVIPLFNNGQTFGSKFLNIKFVVPKYKGVYLLIRTAIIYAYWLLLPTLLFSLTALVINAFNFSDIEVTAIYFIDLMIFFLYYLISTINLLAGGKMLYDRFIKVQCVSTIKISEGKNV